MYNGKNSTPKYNELMKTGIPGLTFSWKRALGITQLKQKISRTTGIPMSKQGLERKVGSMILKNLLGK